MEQFVHVSRDSSNWISLQLIKSSVYGYMNGNRSSLIILSNNSSDCPRSSGIILNFGRPYFTNLADKCVSEVNAMIDHYVIPLVRKAMI